MERGQPVSDEVFHTLRRDYTDATDHQRSCGDSGEVELVTQHRLLRSGLLNAFAALPRPINDSRCPFMAAAGVPGCPRRVRRWVG